MGDYADDMSMHGTEFEDGMSSKELHAYHKKQAYEFLHGPKPTPPTKKFKVTIVDKSAGMPQWSTVVEANDKKNAEWAFMEEHRDKYVEYFKTDINAFHYKLKITKHKL